MLPERLGLGEVDRESEALGLGLAPVGVGVTLPLMEPVETAEGMAEGKDVRVLLLRPLLLPLPLALAPELPVGRAEGVPAPAVSLGEPVGEREGRGLALDVALTVAVALEQGERVPVRHTVGLPVEAALALAVAHRVGEREAVGERLPLPLRRLLLLGAPLPLPRALPVPAAATEAQAEALGEELPRPGLPVAAPVGEALSVKLPVAAPEVEEEGLMLALTEPVVLGLGERDTVLLALPEDEEVGARAVAVGVPLALDGVTVKEGVLPALLLPPRAAVEVPLAVAGAGERLERGAEREGATEGVRQGVKVGVLEAQGVALREGVPLALALGQVEAEVEMVEEGEREGEGVWLPLADTLPLGLRVLLRPLPLLLGLWLALREGLLRAEPEALPDSVGLREREGEMVRVTLPV